MRRAIYQGLFLWSMIAALPANAQSCRQALVLGLDVSLSVNKFDFALQRGGLARALLDETVMDVMLRPEGHHLELAIFEWSGRYNHDLLVDWTVIDSRARLIEISEILLHEPQASNSGRTAIGAAMRYARDLFRQRPNCVKWTLDLSGDGQNNNGVQPQRVLPEMEDEDITVNGLVIDTGGISGDDSGLTGYYHRNVITGPGAFVQTIYDFEDYESAIKQKLLRELVTEISELKRPHQPPRQDPLTKGFRAERAKRIGARRL